MPHKALLALVKSSQATGSLHAQHKHSADTSAAEQRWQRPQESRQKRRCGPGHSPHGRHEVYSPGRAKVSEEHLMHMQPVTTGQVATGAGSELSEGSSCTRG